jgi:hypothetical protein
MDKLVSLMLLTVFAIGAYAVTENDYTECVTFPHNRNDLSACY